jgi:phage baseplate assembly protein W
MSDEFVGAGWAFPLRTDATGQIALVRHDREIEESIRLILGTAYGERPMRPDYGCAIHDYVFATVDSDVAGRIIAEVRVSLVRWEPRIRVRDVEVTVSPDDPTLVYIDIRYTIVDTNDPRNLVVPFYTIPAEE